MQVAQGAKSLVHELHNSDTHLALHNAHSAFAARRPPRGPLFEEPVRPRLHLHSIVLLHTRPNGFGAGLEA